MDRTRRPILTGDRRQALFYSKGMGPLPIRRRTFLSLALAGLAPWRGHGAAAADARPLLHGIAMHGWPSLPKDFTHLPYANPQAPKGGRVVLGFPGTFDSLNSFNVKAGSAAHGLVGTVYQGLLARNLDEPFSLYAQIAQAIELDDARQHLVFHLNPAARFSDGMPLTAQDVLFSFELLKTKGRPQQRVAYGLVRNISAPDAHTVAYDLTGAQDRELPLILGLMPVFPKHALDVARFGEANLTPPIGSGPYRVTQVQPGDNLVLTRNTDWWGQDLPVAKGLFNFDEIRLQYFRDGNALYEAFKSGLIDYRDETDPSRWLTGYDFPALNDGRVRRETLALGGPKGMQGFAFNTRRALFQDVAVREALVEMFDFEWINANFFGNLYRRTKSFFDESPLSCAGRAADSQEMALLSAFPGAVRPDIMGGTWAPPLSDGSGRDRARAHRALNLLESAGWQIIDGTLTKKATGEAFQFEIMVADRPTERLALIYADMLKRLGIKPQVRNVDDVQYQRRRQTFDFDMTIGTWLASASPGNEQRGRWSSAAADQPSSFNLAGVKSPAVDAMIQAILAAQTQDDFEAAVRALDRVLLSGFWIVPLFHTPNAWVGLAKHLQHPARLPTFGGSPPFGPTLDLLWHQDN